MASAQPEYLQKRSGVSSNHRDQHPFLYNYSSTGRHVQLVQQDQEEMQSLVAKSNVNGSATDYHHHHVNGKVEMAMGSTVGDEEEEEKKKKSWRKWSSNSKKGAGAGTAMKKQQLVKGTTTWTLMFSLESWRRRATAAVSPQLAMHLLTAALLLAFLSANIKYVVFKVNLYLAHLPAVFAAPWLMVVLGCEILYLLCGLISAVDYLVPPLRVNDSLSLQLQHLPPISAAKGHGHSHAHLDSSSSEGYPTVDVMIPCCREPTEVPQESVLAALALDYPADRFRVFVLDDGGDDALQAFCHAIQAESGGQQLLYLRRKKIPGVPHHFKCGNMNYGLQHSSAEFVVMMDADMILHSSFLRRMIPHIMNNPSVAFVQIPQTFYNLPVGDPLNDACGFFYDRVLSHRNSLGCATCVGTGAVFRRKHLDEIGGFQPQSITEDTMTAYVLFNKGYKSVYINEKLQVGLTPWTFEGFVKQRQRWGQGAIQQLLTTWKVMLGRKSRLNLLQKVCYFWHTGFYYMSILNVVLFITLWAALAFDLELIVGDEEENRKQITYLAVYLVLWRVFWYALWVEVPQAIQSRNRDESQFWWMTPYFFKMVMETFFNYKGTFKFVPTSNIDRKAAESLGKRRNSCLSGLGASKLRDMHHVRVHIFVIVVGLSTVAVKCYAVLTRYGLSNCSHSFQVIGLSMFIVTVCAHMFVPVMHILRPTGYKPEQRKSLLKYNAMGVPQFNPSECYPKWHPVMYFYEALSYTNLLFWIAIYWSVHSSFYDRWCLAN